MNVASSPCRAASASGSSFAVGDHVVDRSVDLFHRMVALDIVEMAHRVMMERRGRLAQIAHAGAQRRVRGPALRRDLRPDGMPGVRGMVVMGGRLRRRGSY
ncbi:hypothetical protein LJB71_05770 [Thermomonas sp. S9]|uniref:hypothetical protein n=1 Tax=Thermomonas sp. S9 TaxID=2885203 RepID=UPI00216AE654|nr:hypothetical protein [Thermomonas sp. S9]MCR6495787.1 hypothetical protein [Thermomonas sp. S9]